MNFIQFYIDFNFLFFLLFCFAIVHVLIGILNADISFLDDDLLYSWFVKLVFRCINTYGAATLCLCWDLIKYNKAFDGTRFY